MNADPLPKEFLLNLVNTNSMGVGPLLKRCIRFCMGLQMISTNRRYCCPIIIQIYLEADRSCYPSPLAGHGARHHVPHGAVGHLVPCDTPAPDQQVPHPWGHQTTVRDLNNIYSVQFTYSV